MIKYLDPAKDVFFLVGAIFRRSSKNQHNKQFWCRCLSLLRCFFVTSASFGRHVFYRELAAFFCVMFSGETEKNIVSGSRYTYLHHSTPFLAGVLYARRLLINVARICSLNQQDIAAHLQC